MARTLTVPSTIDVNGSLTLQGSSTNTLNLVSAGGPAALIAAHDAIVINVDTTYMTSTNVEITRKALTLAPGTVTYPLDSGLVPRGSRWDDALYIQSSTPGSPVTISGVGHWVFLSPDVIVSAIVASDWEIHGGGASVVTKSKTGMADVVAHGGGVLTPAQRKIASTVTVLNRGGGRIMVDFRRYVVGYRVMFGFESHGTGQFKVGSLVAPAVDTPGYDTLGGLFNTSFLGTYDELTKATSRMIPQSVEIKRGSAQTGGIQSGSVDVVVKDLDGMLDPEDTGSPLFGLVDIMLPCRIQATVDSGAHWEDLAWGWLRTGDFDYDWGTQEVRFTFEDLFAWFDRYKDPGPVIDNTGPIQTQVAIGLIADAIQWPISRRDFDTSSTILGDFFADGSKGALDLLKELLAVDGGAVFQDRKGNLVYRSALADSLIAPSATLDNGRSVRPGLASDNVKNVASVTKEGEEEVVYQNDESVARYGPSGAGNLTSAFIRDVGHAQQIAQRLVRLGKDSRYRFWDYELMADADTIHTLLVLDYGDKVTVGIRDYDIVAVNHKITAGGRQRTSYTLEESHAVGTPFLVGSRVAPDVASPGYDVVVDG